MAELRESALISAKECEDIAQGYDPYDGRKWHARLMGVAIPKGTNVVTKISTVLEEHKISRISSVLKGVLCVGGVLSCNYYCILTYTCISCMIYTLYSVTYTIPYMHTYPLSCILYECK